MAWRDYVFASESVAEGHPDKICDRIADAVVDTFLGADPHARAACETLATTNRVVLAGEARRPDAITHEQLIEVARAAIRDIGYEQQGRLLGSGTPFGNHQESFIDLKQSRIKRFRLPAGPLVNHPLNLKRSLS